jgi:hypothetical protein
LSSAGCEKALAGFKPPPDGRFWNIVTTVTHPLRDAFHRHVSRRQIQKK